MKSSAMCVDKGEHKSRVTMAALSGPANREWRAELRAMLSDLPGGVSLLRREGREAGPEEGPEPAQVL